MRKKTTRLGWGALFAMVLAAGSLAGQYKVVGHKGELYFGHISYVDTKDGGSPPVVFRLGATSPEAAVLNLPLGPGDAVQTPPDGRCEIQFDNGTIVRLDTDTNLKIETILAPGLSTAKKITNLLLAQGRVYVMYREHSSKEIFQVIMPSAAVKLSDSAVALIEMADGLASVQAERGRAEVLYGKDKDDVAQKKVDAGQRIVVGADDIAAPAEYSAATEFKSWNEKINANFQALHEGSVLPKPLQKLPPAVFEFAQKFGNLHGEWLWHDLYGYVWRPHLNDQRYPWGNWQPYFYGNWSDYNGQLYWVPGEPWGWVPYHLGLWMWDEKSGWVWMPGSLFAPAWVDWEFLFGHYFWRPFTLFDYYEGLDDPYMWGFPNRDPAVGRLPGTTPDSPPPTTPVRTVVGKDNLKKKSSPSLPVPKEMKGALKAAGEALKKGDPAVQASMRETLRRSVIVSKTDFAKPGWQEKAVPLDRFLERPEVKERGPRSLERVPSESVAKDALRRYETVRVAGEVKAELEHALPDVPGKAKPADFGFGRERPAARPEATIQGSGRPGAPVPAGERVSGSVPTGSRAAARPGIRFRDWNPDVRTAVRAGADLDYSSRTNEVYSSRLGLRSGDGSPRSRRWTPDGTSDRLAPDSVPGETVVPSPATESSVSKGSLKKKDEEKKKGEEIKN